jgi:N6-adenosine-specific RNA methylase IME4
VPIICNLVARIANDRTRGLETRPEARAFVRRHCPCATCDGWRAEQARQARGPDLYPGCPPARVLVVDPPWAFDDALPGDTRGAARQYHVEGFEALRWFTLPPQADDCLLFLWRVAAMEEQAAALADAWGYTPTGGQLQWNKTAEGSYPDAPLIIDPEAPAYAWASLAEALGVEDAREKLRGFTASLAFGMGRTTRATQEVCAIYRRKGAPARPVADRGVRSGFFAPVGAHSAKPDRFFALVERLVGPEGGPFVELFARRPRRGWYTYGDECPQTTMEDAAP